MLTKQLPFAILLAISNVALAQTIVNTQPGPKKAIIEEFTGVHCSSCPELGHDLIDEMQLTNTDNAFYVIMYSPTNSSYTEPAFGSADFRRVFLDDFYMHAYCAPQTLTRAMPSAFVNRRIWASGDRWQAPDLWEQYTEAITTEGNSPMNIGIRSVYDEQAQTITVDLEIYYHSTVTESNSFYVFLGEHDLSSDYQNGSSESPYMYKSNFFRETLTTGTWGDPVTGPTVAGSLFTTQLTFSLNDAIDPLNMENVDVLAFVIEDQSTEIYTGIQAPADGGLASTGVGSVGIDEQATSTLQLFPNPATDIVTLNDVSSDARISILNSLGQTVREIPATGGKVQFSVGDLQSGIYFVQVMTKNKVNSAMLLKQ